MNFGYLYLYKLRHSYKDTVNPFFSSSLKWCQFHAFFLHYHFYYANPAKKLALDTNQTVLLPFIKFIKDSQRFDESLL